jgi:hypothetical protein
MEDQVDVRWRKSSYSGNGGVDCVEVGIAWRKSSHSGNGGGECVEVGATWHKSSHSGNGGGNCIEVARGHPRVVAVRDSKDPDGPVLAIGPTGWRDFIADVKTGRHDLA